MTYDEFVGQVQHRARLGSKGEAVSAIRATLGTLAERLTLGEAKDLASQLPREIALYLAIRPEMYGQRLSLDDFFKLIASREPAGEPVAAFHARVVMEVLGEAVSIGEMRDVFQQLPDEFLALAKSGSQGAMRSRQ